MLFPDANDVNRFDDPESKHPRLLIIYYLRVWTPVPTPGTC